MLGKGGGGGKLGRSFASVNFCYKEVEEVSFFFGRFS